MEQELTNTHRKKFPVSLIVTLSVILVVFLFYIGFSLYTKYRMQKLPHMQVVLEMNILGYLDLLAKNKDSTYYSIMDGLKSGLKDKPPQEVFNLIQMKFSEKQIPINKYFGNKYESNTEIITAFRDSSLKALESDREIILDRLDRYGVYEPSVQKQSNWHIVVVIPLEAPEKMTEDKIDQLFHTALLEFRLVKDPEFTISVMKKIDETLAKSTNGFDKDSASLQDLTEEEFRKQHPFFSVAMLDQQGRSADAYVKNDDKNKIALMLSNPEVQKVIPNNVEFVFSAKSIGRQNGQDIYIMYLVNREPELTGGVVTDAHANIDPATSTPIVNMTMNSEGATYWARITGANVGKRIAIMLDGVVYTAPSVRNKITGGRSQIEGMANMEEAKMLEVVLRAGMLPAPLQVVSHEVISKENDE